MRVPLFLLVTLLLVGNSMQLGVLWVNNIRGNSDTLTVQIEEVIVDDNRVLVDFVDGLSTNLVVVEDIEFSEGSVRVPVNLLVEEIGTIEGLFNANGGILADDAEFGGFSFKVEDDTGITTLKRGELRPDGGINVDNLKFEVKPSGETTIAEAPLRPNGGINSNNGQFTVSADDGSVLTQGTATVELDIILGTEAQEDRFITRVPTDARNGGATVISGQGSFIKGGDLVLLPGYGFINNDDSSGHLILGRQEPDDLLVTRADARTTDAGDTTFRGQDSTGGNGGDLILEAGSSQDDNYSGGDIVLAPGAPGAGGVPGEIHLGNDEGNDFDLNIRRTPLTGSGPGGDTYIHGQDSITGRGGNLILRAGDSAVSVEGADLVLEPGYSFVGQGVIYLGRPDSDEIIVSRVDAATRAAATTVIHAQDSFNGAGGDLLLEAGQAATNTGTGEFKGGSIHLVPGQSTNGATPGRIYWGTATENLEVLRPVFTQSGQATETIIRGQDATVGAGGDLTITSGSSLFNEGSGNLHLSAPDGTRAGGSVAVHAGDALGSGAGGVVSIAAGHSFSGSNPGGDVTITAGDGNVGGNIEITAGSGNTPGSVIITEATDRFITEDIDVVVQNGVIRLVNDNNDELVFRNDPEGIITFNGNVLLKQRQFSVAAPLALLGGLSSESTQTAVLALQQTLNSIIRALSPCGHGLIGVVNENGLLLDPVTTPTEYNQYCAGGLNTRSVHETTRRNLENYEISCSASASPTPDDQSCLMLDNAIMPDALADRVQTV